MCGLPLEDCVAHRLQRPGFEAGGAASGWRAPQRPNSYRWLSDDGMNIWIAVAMLFTIAVRLEPVASAVKMACYE